MLQWREPESRGDAGWFDDDAYRTMIEVCPVPIAVIEPDTTVRLWNAAAARLFGWTADEVRGRPIPIVPETPLAECREPHAVVQGGERLVGVETRRVTRDGGSIDVALSAVPLTAGDGRVTAIMLVFEDLSERRPASAAERTAALAAARFERFFEIMPIGLAWAGDAECRRIDANPAMAHILGIPPDTNASKSADPALPFRILRDGHELPADELPMQVAAATGRSRRDVVLQVERTGGERVDLLANVAPLFDAEGRPNGCVAAFLDITERARHEEALRATNRAKDEFLAMLGHELRNPLAAVRNAVVAARREPSGAERALAIADRQAAQLAHLVDDLLDVARITHGCVTLRQERMSLRQSCRAVVDAMLATFEERGQTLVVSLPPDEVWVQGDPARLEQVLANLLSNASKFSPHGGEIALSVAMDGAEAVVRARDHGIGISRDLLPRVFDLFAQGDRALDRAEGGLGLGLTIVRRIVEAHGGRVEARSEGLGHGAELVMRLPATAAPAPVAPSGPTVAGDAAVRVLIVEDNRDAAESLAILLELFGHDVRMVHDGLAAIDAAGAALPDVMLVDIGLPGIDGYEVARRLRSDARFAPTTLVALTGYGRDDDQRRAVAAGFDRHLVKPVTVEALQEILDGVAARARTARAG